MQTKEHACWMLTASAMVLAGLLVMSLRGRFAALEAPAQAGMVTTAGGDHQFMTVRLSGGDERLLVIDNSRRVLLVYSLEQVNKSLVPELAQDLEALFTIVAGPPRDAQPERVPR